MATQTTTTAGLTDQYQNYFSKKLLSYAVQALVLDQFGNKVPLPAKSGHKAISMFRFDAPKTTEINTLTEGDPSSVGERGLTLTKVDASLIQRGQIIKLSDVLNATDLFNSLQQSVKINGQDAALDMDQITRNILVGSDVGENANSGGTAAEAGISGLTEMYADGTDDYSDFVSSTTDNTLDAGAILDAVTKLKVNRAQPIKGGQYVCVTSPQVLSDLMKINEWLNAAQYSNVDELYKGEVGSLYGAKFVTTTRPWISGGSADTDRYVYDESAGGGTAASKDIHASLFLGDQAYGIPELSSQSPFSPKIVITDSADKSDPLNLTITAGFKCFWTAMRLNPDYYVIMRSKTASTA